MKNELLLHDTTALKIRSIFSKPKQVVALTGPDGSGKKHIAFSLVGEIIGLDNTSTYPYLKVIDAKKNKVGIDEIRQIKEFLALTVPGKGTWRRAAVVANIEMLGHEAQNALLKTLEEPPADTLIIVTYSQPSLVLPTIKSRVIELQILPVALNQANSFFADQASPEEIRKAFYLSNGLVGLMASLIKESSDHLLVKGIDEAKNILTMPRYKRVALVDRVLKDKNLGPLTLIDCIYKLTSASYHLAVNRGADKKKLKRLYQNMQVSMQAMNDLEQNVQPKLVLSRLFSIL